MLFHAAGKMSSQSEAVALLLSDHIIPHSLQHDPNNFRSERLYVELVDAVFRRFEEDLNGMKILMN